jgi:hypothetical protein
MSKNKDLIVYWSPPITTYDGEIIDRSFLYPKPESIFLDKSRQKSKLSMPHASFFACPAVNKKMQNTIVFSNSVNSSYHFDFTDIENKVVESVPNSLDISVLRNPILDSGPCLSIGLSYMLFAEESVNAFFTPPYFHEAKYTKYGAVMPGEFDIGQWFRPYHIDLQMWNNKGNLVIEDGEPLFYVEFKTDKRIKLKQFNMNKTLTSFSNSCVDVTRIFGPGQTLKSRYDRFKQVGMRDKVLTEIKKNLVEEN